MHRSIKAILVAVLAVVACAGMASSASAVRSVTTTGGTYTATTNALQTLTTTAGIFFRLQLTCNQRLIFNIPAGTYTASTALQTIGTVTRADFICNDGRTVTALNLPWTVAGVVQDSSILRLAGARGSTILLRVLRVQVQATDPAGTCLFGSADGNAFIGFSITDGSTAGNLLGGSLRSNSGLCSTGTVSAVGYTVSPAPAFSIAL